MMVHNFWLRYASDVFVDGYLLTDLLPPAFISTQRRISLPKQDLRSPNASKLSKRSGKAAEVLIPMFSFDESCSMTIYP